MSTPRRRRPGRPALDAAAPSVNVHLRMTAPHYDAAYARASAERLTLAEWIRRVTAAAVGRPRARVTRPPT